MAVCRLLRLQALFQWELESWSPAWDSLSPSSPILQAKPSSTTGLSFPTRPAAPYLLWVPVQQGVCCRRAGVLW